MNLFLRDSDWVDSGSYPGNSKTFKDPPGGFKDGRADSVQKKLGGNSRLIFESKYPMSIKPPPSIIEAFLSCRVDQGSKKRILGVAKARAGLLTCWGPSGGRAGTHRIILPGVSLGAI